MATHKPFVIVNGIETQMPSGDTLDVTCLPASGVTAGTTGSSTVVPVITYDSYGRVTSVSTATVAQPSSANPSASIGATAVNGSASTFMRSDAAPAIGTNAVTNSLLAQAPAYTFKGNLTGSTANITDITWSQILTLAGVTFQYENNNIQTSSYILAFSDSMFLVAMNVATANTVTIPNSSSVYFPVGTWIDIQNVNTGATTVTAATGVSLNGTSAGTYILAQNQRIKLVNTGTDTWLFDTLAAPTNSIANSQLTHMAANTLKGNNTSSSNDPIDLTVAQAQAMLAVPSSANPSATIGASATNGSATTFMRSDAAPAIGANAVTNALMAQMATATVKGNVTGSTDTPQDVTLSSLMSSMGVTTSTLEATNAQSGSYTLALTDDFKLVTINSSSANTLTIPAYSSVSFPVGAWIDIQPIGTGTTTISCVGGVTLNGVAIGSYLMTPYQRVRLVNTANNVWLLGVTVTSTETTNAQTSSYTPVLTDAMKLVTMNSTSTNTFTIPPYSSVSFATGTWIDVQQIGTGFTTILAGSSTTLNGVAQGTYLMSQYQRVRLVCTAANVWLLNALPNYQLNNAQTGTTYQIVITDQQQLITMNNAAANTLTIPTYSSVSFPVGTWIDVQQIGAGVTTIVAASSVTLNGTATGTYSLTPYQRVRLVQTAQNYWVLNATQYTQTVNTYTASYTLALTDSTDLVTVNSSSANTLTIPIYSTVAFPTGTFIDIMPIGTGVTTVTAASGVTLNGTGTGSVVMSQWQRSRLTCTAANTWILDTFALAANSVTNTYLAQMAANTIKGNNTASTSNAIDLTAAQVAVMVSSNTAAGMVKNYLVNSQFDFWQTGTSFTTSGYTADQWYGVVAGTCTFSQKAINNTYGMYGLTWTTGASSSSGTISQPIEQAKVIPLIGTVVTFSIFVSSTSLSGTMTFAAYYSTSTDARASLTSSVTITSGATFTPNSTMARYSCVFTVPATATGLMVQVGPTSTQASGVSATFAQAQLEEGSVPSTYNCPLYNERQSDCLRFYEKTFKYGTTPAQNLGTGMGEITVLTYGTAANVGITYNWRFTVPKRTTPTITTYNTAAANSNWSGGETATATVVTNVSCLLGNSTTTTAGVRRMIQATADARL